MTKYQLCDTEFWDPNVSWYSDQPYLSSCFRNTALVWIPSFVIFVVLFCEASNIRNARANLTKQIPWNLFNISRLLLTFSLLLIEVFEISKFCYESIVSEDSIFELYSISSLLAPIIQSLCYLILATTYFVHREVGIHTSASIWFYLSFSLITSSIDTYFFVHSNKLELNNLTNEWVNYLHLVLVSILFILECRGDSAIRDQSNCDSRPESPEIKASFFSRITFSWFQAYIIFGFSNKIEVSNIYKSLDRDRATRVVSIFREAWVKFPKRNSRSHHYSASGTNLKDSDVITTLLRLFWPRLMVAALLKAIQDILQYTTPILLKLLLAYIADEKAFHWHGYLYASLLLIVPTIQSITLGAYFYQVQLVGLHVKTMIIGAVYRKALLLSGSSRLNSTTGEIINLMAVDSQRFQDIFMTINLIWSAPIQLFIALTLLYRELGWSVLVGFIFMLLILPTNMLIARRFKFLQVKIMKIKDERIKKVNEILNGIKVIKLYAWENSFISYLLNFRSQELDYLNKSLTTDALQDLAWFSTTRMIALISFTTFVFSSSSNVFTAEKAFVSMSLFNLVRFPLTVLPTLVSSLVMASVSAKRINSFLNNDELVKFVTREDEPDAVAIEGGSVSWTKSEDDKDHHAAILRDIDLHIKPKSFVAIVGQVASGKTCLISSILGEVHRISGRFNICKNMKLAYVPQQAWLQNMSIKNNILFCSPYDEEKYKKILSVCCLQPDLETLPAGDLSEIGEKGINLSGGQKQRVSLARACYSNSDIYLLDDPLSALDSHVGKQIFDQILSSSTGILKDKTRILATNSLFVLPHVDQIIVLRGGTIVESGTYHELMSSDKSYLSEYMREYSSQEEHYPNDDSESPKLIRDDGAGTIATKQAGSGKLTEVESVETGSVNLKVYLKYLKTVTFRRIALIMVASIVSTGLNIFSNFWLANWSSDSKDPARQNDSNLKVSRVSVYGTLLIFQCFLQVSGNLCLFKGTIRASRLLHLQLMERVMHSPMVFFDTTPIGRIVNRFSKDIDVVDITLPITLRALIFGILSVLSTVVVICYSFPIFLIVVAILLAFYSFILRFFVTSTRQLKRIESTTRSPVYSHFSETLNGTSSIRAYDCVDRFVSHSDHLIDINQSCYTSGTISANRWLSIRLELLGNFLTAAAAMYSVYYREDVGASVAGLTISYSLNITMALSWLVKLFSELETNVVSVERIVEYTNNKMEDEWIKEERPSVDWPDKGCISIQNYSTRYREDVDLVLKNISLDIGSGEKIGIVGRTGSGKSSLSLSLFRILESVSGKIEIDGVDISRFGLHDLRSRLTVIPQDPVLISGTLRFNLDPLDLYTDSGLWRALEMSNLKEYIKSTKDGLSYQVSEYGGNFSVGQRQLICLARAILRKSKILILDEATASVDLATDNMIQKTIRDVFSDCTILTIAHRLHTILDSDRILVLDNGEVAELGSLKELISRPNSKFSTLVRDAGLDLNNLKDLSSDNKKN